ncbi:MULTISPECIES: lanthionine synthetase LanC family protein [unclassified Paenibacillus]|uniref:class III lanthionine synthetase LanKC N-terminal domain-containing protein n=1 Tax=unclassified Paenibacillus TaxID=185978 RepID=UPI0009A72AC6|nr:MULTISPECIES: lanthionine synthetase LanC family protein [unclassified Paenibacillus]SLK08221.1 Protein kinase domain-containing protein [Paenibacillus sp. RU5A]SOC70963.1 Protein kinase domain-containing protein [Paenibacillus sp. RU26A]SOC73427.1 Protein kinase domain-containing protein [Paenibacillus sp. RU5M]
MKFANVSAKKDAFENALEHIIRELPQSIQWSNDGHWICFRPEDLKLPSQGWKIHLSVVPGVGAELLRRITPVLTKHGVQWKVVNSGLKLIETSNGSSPLPQTGKCVTIYAANEKQFLNLLEDMYVCTSGFEGPAIPTDRSYRESGCVFYRYGAFTERFYYDRYSGAKVHAIQNTEGKLEEDRRIPGRYKPEWVNEPEELLRIQATKKDISSSKVSSANNNEFGIRNIRVKRVFKKSGKGGVFLISNARHAQAVMKEAVHRMRVDSAGRSAHDYLENEYHVLELLKETGYTPQPLDLFNYEKNRYLILEYFDSISLREYIHRRHVAADYTWTEMARICQDVLDMVETCHRKGVIINDLTPNNIVVLPDGNVRLIDLELAYLRNGERGTKPLTGHTPGYVSRGREHSQRSSFQDDIYSLGAVFYYMASSVDPYFKYQTDYLKCGQALLDGLVNMQELRDLGNLSVRIMTGMYDQLADIRNDLDAISKEPMNEWQGSSLPWNNELTAAEVLRQAQRMADWLYKSLDFDNRQELYPENSMSRMFHPANFNFGWTGMVYGFNQLGHSTQLIQYHQYAREVMEWILVHHPYIPDETPTGLYFGYGAVPWRLAETAEALNDSSLLDLAENLALQLTQDEPTQTNISHGAAGLGLMLLEIYRIGGRAELLERAEVLAAYILNQEERREDGLSMWKVKEQPSKKNGGHYSLGFSHGIAGIGYFLLAMADRTDKETYISAVKRIVYTLDCTSHTGQNGQKMWPATLEKPDTLWVHWCNGSAGIGRFLLAAADVLGDPLSARLGKEAADAVAQTTIFASFGQCHGLAGNGDLLLLAERCHPGRYAARLEQYAQMLLTMRSDNHDMWMWPLEDMESFSPDYMTGYMGVYSFLLRLFYPSRSAEALVYSGFNSAKEAMDHDINIHI